MSDTSSDSENFEGDVTATDDSSSSQIASGGQPYNELVNSEKELRVRAQKLRTRLQATQKEMSNNNGKSENAAIVEQKARQLMRILVPQQQTIQFSTNAHILAMNNRACIPVIIPMAMPPQRSMVFRTTAYPGIPPMPMLVPQIQIQMPAPMPLKQPTAQMQPNPSTPLKLKKSKKVLNAEVNALKELVHTLSSANPHMYMYTGRLIQNNEILKKLDWSRKENAAPFAHNNAVPINQVPNQEQLLRVNGGNEFPGTRMPTLACMPQQPHQQQQRPIDGRIRRESEVSGSSVSNRNEQPAQMQSQEEPKVHVPRKRNRTKRSERRALKARLVETELTVMQTYINNIIQNFLGTNQLLPPEMRFDGEFSDLDAYAQRLVAAGYGRIVEEEIRINRKNNRQAFISLSNDRETMERDAIFMIPVARRYALDGDTVRAFVLNVGAVILKGTEENGTIKELNIPQSSGEEEDIFDETESQESDADNVAVIMSDDCPKAFVIEITKQTALRQIVGTIFFNNPSKFGNDQLFYKFHPHDMRVPMVYIPQSKCAEHIANQKFEDVSGLLYLAQILETDCNGHCIAELIQPVGRVGNLKDEVKAILFHNNLRDIEPFDQRFNDMYDQAAPPVSAADLEQRQDLRSCCIFTIDPLTARDLDDAISLEKLDNNDFEVGVHISDVSHYLQENSELDNIVKTRSTSIYLINEVIHMLPKPLCLRCSLLPGEDKFAFSVFWHISANGEILGNPRFQRTVIRSCTQFAYEHAQKIIDNPLENFTGDDFPPIVNGFTVKDVMLRVQWMHKIASIMRKRRFDNGALTISKPKLRFALDPDSGEPESFEIEKQREANCMIEEFMLLANQAVARIIYDTFPNIAILRNHAPPLMKSMKSLREKMLSLGFELDYSSSKAVQDSIIRMCKMSLNPVAMNALVSQLLMKPMARAKYYCSEDKRNAAELCHYALSIPIYTHFTSPIRRYPDIMVHRLLAAALKYCETPARSTEELHALMKIANDRKYNAKQAGDDAVNFYFKRFVHNKKSILMHAVIFEIYQHMLNVVTLESSHVIGIHYKMQKQFIDNRNAPNFIIIADQNSKQSPTKLQLLSVVLIRVILWENNLIGFFLSDDQRKCLASLDNNATKANTYNEQASYKLMGFNDLTSRIPNSPQRMQVNSNDDGQRFSPNCNYIPQGRQQQQQQQLMRQQLQQILAMRQNSL